MTKPMNDVISLLGVQGLSRNNYSVVQLKVVLAIIGHAQKVIKDYVVDGRMPNKSMRKRLTARQMADGYVVVVIHQALHHYPLLGVEGIYQDRSQEVCGADARQGELLQILQRSDVEEPPAGTRRPEATLRLWHGGSVSHAICLLFRRRCPES